MTDAGDHKQPVKSADRVFDILELLMERRDGATLKELADALRLAPSSAHALVQTMLARHYITQRERKLFPGTKFYELISRFDGRDLLDRAKPVMQSLAADVNENVHLAVLDGIDVVFISCIETTHPIRYHIEVGYRQRSYATAVGKMLLSQYDDQTIAAMFDRHTFAKLTAGTIDSLDRLLQEMRNVRERGFAVDNGESQEGAKCFAAPVHDASRAIVAGLSISLPNMRRAEGKESVFVDKVTDAARRISLHDGTRVIG